MSPLQAEWRGVAALVWLILGGVIAYAIEKVLDPLVREYFEFMWIFGGWLAPALVMAIAGVRNGNIASRVCGALVLIALLLPVLFILYAGYQLSGH
jgi:hypothetical protein